MRTDLTWAPSYKLKRSKRAKHVSITIHPSEGLRVTIPFKAKERDALVFLNKQRRWIEKHSDLLKPENIAQEQQRYQLPQQIELRAIEQQWETRFRYLPDSKRVLLHFFEKRLIFSGNICDFKCCVPLIKPWLTLIGRPQ